MSYKIQDNVRTMSTIHRSAANVTVTPSNNVISPSPSDCQKISPVTTVTHDQIITEKEIDVMSTHYIQTSIYVICHITYVKSLC